jgi:hypothetical protein
MAPKTQGRHNDSDENQSHRLMTSSKATAREIIIALFNRHGVKNIGDDGAAAPYILGRDI